MASENNLTAVFTDIANAIRDKKGSVNTIKPINMADEILTISSGVSVKDFITTRNARYLFYDCGSLTSEQLASVLKYDDTSGATNMYNMFYYCSNLTTIPLIDTSGATNMESMFNGCSNLTTIPQLDTSKATKMSSMFRSCSSLTAIPQLDTSSCTSMSSMFSYCGKLTTVLQLDTSKVTDISYMFQNCISLTNIPQLNTSKATKMSSMFQQCYKLEKIDITKLVSGTNYNNHFASYCYSLKTLIIRTMDTIPTLNSNSFTDCYHFTGTVDATYNPNGLKDGRIYVPDDKVASLKTATNWSVFADIIKPLSEYVE